MTSTVQTEFHHAVAQGEKRKVKRMLLKFDIPVDIPDVNDNSALYTACSSGYDGLVSVLLRNGANPNRRNNEGITPVLAAAKNCNIKSMSMILIYGGDLRLHDKSGKSVYDWINSCEDFKKKQKMFRFIKKLKAFALLLLCEEKKAVSKTEMSFQRLKKEQTHYWTTLKRTCGMHNINFPSVYNFGFGDILVSGGESIGIRGLIPLVSESDLKHDVCGNTYNNGPYFVMESMLWKRTKVTVKRVHKTTTDAVTDLLLVENCHILQLRHPSLLLLMGICYTANIDSLVLVYERISFSLFSYLYQQDECLSAVFMCDILKQICDALLFLHERKYVHCNISSHAIQFVSKSCVKLSNFEYMVKCNDKYTKSYATANKLSNALYNWMAPEIMEGKPPIPDSDLYSLCCVMWEVINGMPPWSGLESGDIEIELLRLGNRVNVAKNIGSPFYFLLLDGLSLLPENRNMSLLEFKNVLQNFLKYHHQKDDSELKVDLFPSKFKKGDSSDSSLKYQTSRSNNLPEQQKLQSNMQNDSNLSVPQKLLSNTQNDSKRMYSSVEESNAEYSLQDILEYAESTNQSKAENSFTLPDIEKAIMIENNQVVHSKAMYPDDYSFTLPEMEKAIMKEDSQVVHSKAMYPDDKNPNLQTCADIFREKKSTSPFELPKVSERFRKKPLEKRITQSIHETAKISEICKTVPNSKIDCSNEKDTSKNDMKNVSKTATSDKKFSNCGHSKDMNRIQNLSLDEAIEESTSFQLETDVLKQEELMVTKIATVNNKDKKLSKLELDAKNNEKQNLVKLEKAESLNGTLEYTLASFEMTDDVIPSNDGTEAKYSVVSCEKSEKQTKSPSIEARHSTPGKKLHSNAKQVKDAIHDLNLSGISKLTECVGPQTNDVLDVSDKNKDTKNGESFHELLIKKKSSDDLLSDEIKAILAKPMVMPKLPSYYHKNLFQARTDHHLQRSTTTSGIIPVSMGLKDTNIMSSKLSSQEFKEMTDGQKILSVSLREDMQRPKSPIKSAFSKSFGSRSIFNDFKALSQPMTSLSFKSLHREESMSRSNMSYSSFESSCHSSFQDSVIKPASHHMPQKSPRDINHLEKIEHYAFPKVNRMPTYPGCITLKGITDKISKHESISKISNSKLDALKPQDSSHVNACKNLKSNVFKDMEYNLIKNKMFGNMSLPVFKASDINEQKLHALKNASLTSANAFATLDSSYSTNFLPIHTPSPREQFFSQGLQDDSQHFRSETYIPVKNYTTNENLSDIRVNSDLKSRSERENMVSKTKINSMVKSQSERKYLPSETFIDHKYKSQSERDSSRLANPETLSLAQITKCHQSFGTKPSVKEMANSFQEQWKEHLRKQSCLNSKHNKLTSDVFFTPDHAKNLICPKRTIYGTMEGYKLCNINNNQVNADCVAARSVVQNIKSARECYLKSKITPSYFPATANLPKAAVHKSSTDEDISTFIDNVINVTHKEIQETFVHPKCPHKVTKKGMKISPDKKNTFDETDYLKLKINSSSKKGNNRSGETGDFYFDDEIDNINQDEYLQLETPNSLEELSILDSSALFESKAESTIMAESSTSDESYETIHTVASTSSFRQTRKITSLSDDEYSTGLSENEIVEV